MHGGAVNPRPLFHLPSSIAHCNDLVVTVLIDEGIEMDVSCSEPISVGSREGIITRTPTP